MEKNEVYNAYFVDDKNSGFERKDLLRVYFLKQSNYYIDKHEKLEKGKKFTFNFWAGFFNTWWFIYRKMYLNALIIFALGTILSVLFELIIPFINPFHFNYSEFLVTFIFYTIPYFFILAFLGNYLYIIKANKVVDGFLRKHKLEELNRKDLDILREKGGTNLFLVIILIIVFTIIYGVLISNGVIK